MGRPFFPAASMAAGFSHPNAQAETMAEFYARQYAAQRETRVAQVRRTTWQSGAIYHLPGPIAFARNLTMKVLGGRRLLSQRDWIYDWRTA